MARCLFNKQNFICIKNRYNAVTGLLLVTFRLLVISDNLSVYTHKWKWIKYKVRSASFPNIFFSLTNGSWSFGKIKRSQCARSAEFGGCRTTSMPLVARISCRHSSACCGEETNFHCTSLQAVFTTHPTTDLVESLHRNDGSQFVPVERICDAQVHVYGRKWSAWDTHWNKMVWNSLVSSTDRIVICQDLRLSKQSFWGLRCSKKWHVPANHPPNDTASHPRRLGF